MLHQRATALTSAGSPDGELGCYRYLAANVMARAVDDLRDTDTAVVVSAATFLLEIEESVWSDWLPVDRRMIDPVVLQAVGEILRGEVHGNARRYGRKLKPHHRATLARLIREPRTPVKHG